MKKILFVVLCSFLVSLLHAQLTENKMFRATRFIGLVSEGRYEEACQDFDTLMASMVTAGKLEEFWKALLGQTGEFLGQSAVRSESQMGYDFVFITCEFAGMSLDMKIVFRAGNELVSGFFVQPAAAGTLYTLPAYADTSLFSETEIEILSGSFRLPGTLTLPRGKGPFPVVILVHGSGPNDRDETIGPNKPFRDLSAGLGSKGIAVIRYEKRTRVAASSLDVPNLTLYGETIEDAVSAVRFARDQNFLDPGKVFVLGHSLGGYAAPAIARESGKLAGVILMAANARPLEDLILEQIRYISGLDGLSDEENESIRLLRRQVNRVKTLTAGGSVPPDSLPIGTYQAYWTYLNGYDHLKEARKLKCRMMILQGERDYQVTMQDFQIWKDVLEKKKNTAFHSYKDLNHLFLEGTGKSVPAEYNHAGHIPGYVLQDLAGFILHKPGRTQ